MVDPRIGITFPEYDTGAMLQISGRATKIDFDGKHAAKVYPGALRLIEIEIDQVVQVEAGSIPIRWTTTNTNNSSTELQEQKLVVHAKIQESDDVMSFHLRPKENEIQSLWKFVPGQHLPIFLPADASSDPFAATTTTTTMTTMTTTTNAANIERTYSISAGPDWGEYRISVKRQGLASNFLHDKVQVGDTILVQKPAGDFMLDPSSRSSGDGGTTSSSSRDLVLLSNGIGVTPMISMLHHWANNFSDHPRSKVFWIHGARDSSHHSFVSEVEELQRMVPKGALSKHVAYSQPSVVEDKGLYDSEGRLSADQIAAIVPDIANNADVYICGSDAFVADMNDGLVQQGVPSSRIHYETF